MTINWYNKAKEKRPIIKLCYHSLGWKTGYEPEVIIEDEMTLFFKDRYGDMCWVDKDQEGFLFTYVRKGDLN